MRWAVAGLVGQLVCGLVSARSAEDCALTVANSTGWEYFAPTDVGQPGSGPAAGVEVVGGPPASSWRVDFFDIRGNRQGYGTVDATGRLDTFTSGGRRVGTGTIAPR